MKLSFSDVPKKARTTSLSFIDGKMNLSRATEKWSSRTQTLEIWQIVFSDCECTGHHAVGGWGLQPRQPNEFLKHHLLARRNKWN